MVYLFWRSALVSTNSDGFLIYAFKLVKNVTVLIVKFWLKIDKTGQIEVLGENLLAE
jgi:hypothetical protein